VAPLFFLPEGEDEKVDFLIPCLDLLIDGRILYIQRIYCICI